MDFREITEEQVIDILSKNSGFKTYIDCPDCNGKMVVREGYSKFLGCSNYPKCKCKLGDIYKIPETSSIPSIMTNDFDEEDYDSLFPNGINCKVDM